MHNEVSFGAGISSDEVRALARRRAMRSAPLDPQTKYVSRRRALRNQMMELVVPRDTEEEPWLYLHEVEAIEEVFGATLDQPQETLVTPAVEQLQIETYELTMNVFHSSTLMVS